MKHASLACFAALLMFASTMTQGANFGPAPSFASDDPTISVTQVNANTTTGQLNLTVNGVSYGGMVAYTYLYNIGSVQYYSSTPAVLVAVDGRVVTASVYATHWTTRQSSGRGGGYITQHYGVVGGEVKL